MIDQICAHIHNYFADEAEIRAGAWVIGDGTIELPFLKEGQYFRIVGSALNDGVYEYPAEDLTDETFLGEIWPMRAPAAFRKLAADIAAWQERYGAAAETPYQSESFGGYSYRLKDGASEGRADWRTAFKARLDAWRKLN